MKIKNVNDYLVFLHQNQVLFESIAIEHWDLMNEEVNLESKNRDLIELCDELIGHISDPPKSKMYEDQLRKLK